MEFITYLQQALSAYLPAIINAYEGSIQATDLAAMETAVKQMSHELGNAILQQWVDAQAATYPEDEVVCPHCGEKARYVRRREGMSITLLGRMKYRRPYYSCESCQQGHYPLDQQLGIQPGQMSAAVSQLAALVGIQASFATSHDLLARTTLLELSPHTIRKACQQVGQRVIAHEAGLHERSHTLEAQREQQRQIDKPQRLYGSMDGFKLLLDGGWHEMKAGVWWTAAPAADGTVRPENIRYYVDYLQATEFSELVWAVGFDQQADQADELIFVADGAEWIWRIVQQHYPQAVQIVDWFHACAYIAPVAKGAFIDPDQRSAWIEQVKADLWQGDLDAVIAACQSHIQPQPNREDDPAQQAITYYSNHRHRMDYPAYRAQGYQIGSGTMESGCKQLGLGRLKIAGAQWQADGARLVAKARATYLSGQWDQLNASHHPLPQVA